MVIITDAFREIRKSIKRFLSLLLLVMLAAAFLSGLRTTSPDMKYTASRYYKDRKLMDIRMLSTLGFMEEDLLKVSSYEGVAYAEGSRQVDLLLGNLVVSVFSNPGDINLLYLKEGRYATKNGECVIDSLLVDEMGLKVGDVITLTDPDKDDEDDEVTESVNDNADTAKDDPEISSGEKDKNGSVSENSNTESIETDESEDTNKDEAKSADSENDNNADIDDKTADTEGDNTADTENDNTINTDFDTEVDSQVDTDIEVASTKLNDYTYTIVGIADSPLFVSVDRGTSNIGTGTIAAFIYVPETEYDWDYYTAIYLMLDKTADMEAYTSEYEDYTKDFAKKMESFADGLVESRYEYLHDKSQSILDDSQAKIDDGRAKLDEAQAQIDDAQSKIDDGLKELDATQKMIDESPYEMPDVQEQLDESYKELADAQEEVDDAKAKIADARTEIEDGQTRIDDAQKDIDDMDTGKSYVLSRSGNTGYMNFKQDAEKMGDLAKVFPVIFYLVAALSCLTSMTRMVEDHRGEIGTLKALGYGYSMISIKYIGYAFLASFTGGIIGLIWGCTLLPVLCFTAWKGQYTLPDLKLIAQPDIYIMSVGIAVVAVTGTAYLASRVELQARPAKLMRPRAPKAGKRVFLEKIGFIWNRLKFSSKVSCRNLFRYKQRFWMTVIGIAGCTSLLVVGLGLYDSLYTVIDKQFVEVTHYDAYLDISEDVTKDERSAIDNEIENAALVADHMAVYTDMPASVFGDDSILGTYIIAVRDYDAFKNFISIAHRTDNEEVVMTKGSADIQKGTAKALFTEKLADTYDAKIGDEVEVVMSDDSVVKLIVADIVENYVYNYIYVDFDDLNSITDEDLYDNRFMLKYNENATDEQIDDLSSKLVAMDGASSYTRINSVVDRFSKSLAAVNVAVGIIIVAAAALAFIVLYNLTNINITERVRELATLKVLGFTDKETTNYIYRENTVMTLVGIVIGLFLGKYLLVWLMSTVENNYMMFGRDVSVRSYILAAALTAGFSLFVNIIAHFSIQKINMVESLKSVE